MYIHTTEKFYEKLYPNHTVHTVKKLGNYNKYIEAVQYDFVK